MSVAATPALIPPGDLLRALDTLNGYRRRRLFRDSLPTPARTALDDTLRALQAHRTADPNGSLLDDVLTRLRDAIDGGNLGDVASHDLTRLARWLRTIPTTRRGA